MPYISAYQAARTAIKDEEEPDNLQEDEDQGVKQNHHASASSNVAIGTYTSVEQRRESATLSV